MRWRNRRRSENIEDQRGQSSGSGGGSSNAALMRLLPMLFGRRGGKYTVIIVFVLFGASYFGLDLGMLTGTQSASSGSASSHNISPE